MVTGTRVVAIDGAAGSGKSTLARALARRLRLPYVDTGAMYRAVAAAGLRSGVPAWDGGALLELARGLRFTLASHDPVELEVEGWPAAELRTPAVESIVSDVAAHPRIRAHLHAVQRRLAATGAVMEGRDIASVVFPDAPVKIFVTADPDVRIRRRAVERTGDPGSDIGSALRARDARDARTNPLAPVEGADVMDTTDLDVDTAVDAALDIVRRRAPELAP